MPKREFKLNFQLNNYNIASFDSSRILSEKLQKQKKVQIAFKQIKGADHFFSGHLYKIRDLIIKYVNNQRS